MPKEIISNNLPFPFDERLRIALLLKSKRERLGITKEELAEKMGFTLKKIDAIEEAKMWIPIKKYLLWCQILGTQLTITNH